MSPAEDLSLSWPLGFAVVLLCATLALTLARAHARHMRRQVRQQASDIVWAFSAFLEGSLGANELHETADDTDTGAFWGALESYASRLPRREWSALSRALERNRHASDERTSLRNDSPWRAELAARRLGLVRSRASRRALRRALARSPGIVRFAAARALARYRDRRALGWLLAHPDGLRRRSAKAWASLLRPHGYRAFPLLLAALEKPVAVPALEIAIIETLGALRDLSAAAAIERRLTHPDLELRVAAVRALGRLRATHCASALIAALKDDAWQVRAQAAKALGRVRAPAGVYALTSRLADSSWWVRRHSAYALAAQGEEGRAALAHAAEHHEDRFARDMAAEALAGGVRGVA